MDEEVREAVRQLAADAESGASELVPRALAILRRTLEREPGSLGDAARLVCAAQPSMASLWNAAAAALAERATPGALARFERRWERAGAALRRVAVETLSTRKEEGLAPHRTADRRSLRLVTCSFSGSVVAAVVALSETSPVTVACAEGRPRHEGRRLAAALAAARIPVDFHTDAALASALPGASAVLVGADAVTPAWFLNKCGTLALAAAASLAGVPVFVLATRDKFVPDGLSGCLAVAAHDPGEVWPSPPPGVAVHNPYFERVPLDLVTGVVTDAGLLGAGMVEEACRAAGAAISKESLDTLAGRV